MKTNTLALLASLVVLTTVARAAQLPLENEMVVLPTYTVEAPRYTPVEKQINASLDEMRQQVRAPIAIPAECPALKAVARVDARLVLQVMDKKAAQFVKL
jgi:hypothetical protein